MKTLIIERIKRVKAQKEAALDTFIERVVRGIEDVGSPQDLIKKDYWDITQPELERLISLYGTGNNALSRWIFKHEYAKLKELEKEV